MCVNPIFLQMVFLIKTLVRLITIIVPILLIVVTMFKLVKVVTSGEEELSKALKSFVSKFIAAVIVFLAPTLVNLLMGLITSTSSYESCWINADDVSGHAITAVETFVRYPGKYTYDDISTHKEFLRYIDDEEKKNALEQELNAMKEVLKSQVQTENPDYSGGENPGGNNESYTGTLGSGYAAIQGDNLYKLNEFVVGSEGMTTSCTVSVGPAAGETGSLVVDIGDNMRTTSYGMTQAILGNIKESNNCFTNSGYYYYYQDATFVLGACIPNKSLEGALMCLYKGQLDTVKVLFNKHCNDFDFDNTFTINQIHALLDKAHGGVGIMENTIKSYCQSWNTTKSKTVSADAFFYTNYSLSNGNCWNVGGTCQSVCSYMARRDCEAELFFDGNYNCNAYNKANNKEFKYAKYLETSYKYCAGE